MCVKSSLKNIQTRETLRMGIHLGFPLPVHEKLLIESPLVTLKTATEATEWLNTTLPSSFHPQMIRNIQRKESFMQETGREGPFLEPAHRQRRLQYAEYHENWTIPDWKKIVCTYRTKSITIGQMGTNGPGNSMESHSLTGLPLGLLNMEEILS